MGGSPYEDLEGCFEYIAKHLKYVDTDRAVALGASFGGYLVYCFAGQPLGKRFKALVSHAGIFNASALYGYDVPDAWRVMFGGHDAKLADLKQIFDKWDPSRYAQNWSTPTLIIHCDKDNRCPLTMGLAAFSTLQLKGIESRFLKFSGEGHLVVKPENSLRWHEAVLAWSNRFTGNKPPVERDQ